MDYTINDFFCGCGGMGLGFKQAGYKTLLAWDYDKFAVQSYKHNVDDIAEIKDISQVGPWDIPRALVWTFGFPCQDISIAGKGAGMIKGETRSGLFYAIMDLLEYTYAADRPKVIMAENVKNVKKYLPSIEKEYERLGYKMSAQLYNSKYWGIPQNRERYFIIGVRNDIDRSFTFPEEIMEITAVLLDILDPEVDEKYYLSDEKVADIIKQALEKVFKYNLEFLAEYEAICKSTGLLNLNDIAKTLRIGGNGSLSKKHNYQHVLEPKIQVAGSASVNTSSEHNSRIHLPTGISPTATAVCGGTHHIKIVMPVPQATDQGYAVAEVGDTMNLSYINSDTRRARVGKEVAQTLLTSCTQFTIDPNRFRIRKLTPNEYGKLQGFPMDDWDQIVSNTQAYKQFGNAVSVPVAKALAEAIIEQILKI